MVFNTYGYVLKINIVLSGRQYKMGPGPMYKWSYFTTINGLVNW